MSGSLTLWHCDTILQKRGGVPQCQSYLNNYPWATPPFQWDGKFWAIDMEFVN